MGGDRAVGSGRDQLAEGAGAHVARGEEAALARRHAVVGEEVAGLVLLGLRRESALGDRADEDEDGVRRLLALRPPSAASRTTDSTFLPP